MRNPLADPEERQNVRDLLLFAAVIAALVALWPPPPVPCLQHGEIVALPADQTAIDICVCDVNKSCHYARHKF